MTAGLSRSGFDIDLRQGEAREAAFVQALRAVGYLVEHKSDRKARETGNVFIEYAQKGRPSGIQVTTAHFWAIEFDTNAWVVIETERLKWLCRLAWQEGRRVRGGDYDNYEGVLVPVAHLTRLDYLSIGSAAPRTQRQLDNSLADATGIESPAVDTDAELDALFEQAWRLSHGDAA